MIQATRAASTSGGDFMLRRPFPSPIISRAGLRTCRVRTDTQASALGLPCPGPSTSIITATRKAACPETQAGASSLKCGAGGREDCTRHAWSRRRVPWAVRLGPWDKPGGVGTVTETQHTGSTPWAGHNFSYASVFPSEIWGNYSFYLPGQFEKSPSL